MYRRIAPPGATGLYDPANEHDGCGIALVAKLWGEASHAVVEKALDALENLEHRGAEGADPNTGDGAGILLQIPDGFLRAAVAGVELPPPGRYGVGVCYLPGDEERRAVLEQLIEDTIEAEGQRAIWWRDVPIDERHVGETARLSAPVIRQVLIAASDKIEDQDEFERKLYVIRRVIERAAGRDLALPSFSSRTLIYKGMLTAPQLPRYFTDLRDPRVASRAGARALALQHEHVPELGARAPVPDDRPQRRGQHVARQRQLDAGAGVAARLRAVRRRPREGDPGRPRGRIGLGDLRQRARVARAQRALDPARGDDDGPRGLPDAEGSRPGRQGLLRLPFVPDGAVGRSRGGGVHRRARRRRGARPQRPAAGALDPGHRGLRRARIGDRRHDGGARARPAQGPPRPRQGVPARPRGRQDHRGRGHQAPRRPPPAVRRVVRALGRAHRRSPRPRPAHAADRAAALQAARVRLLAGGPAADHRADGDQGRGAGREHGQRRRAGGAVRPPAAAVRVLQAAVRAGHEPADRPDPRERRDVAAGRRRRRGQPALRRTPSRPTSS